MIFLLPRGQFVPRKRWLAILLLSCMTGSVLLPCLAWADDASAEHRHDVQHHDPIMIDRTMSLARLVDLTMEKYPDATWLTALEQEAAALRQRGESWLAGAPQAGLRFQEATSGTLHYVDATVQLPLWNRGQRDAERKTGEQAGIGAEQQTKAVRLRVAGLVRAALWDMALQTIRYEQAEAELDIARQLADKVKRRVELGDLPHSDQLLADSELLQKRSALTLAEAELMHARKRYVSVTQTNQMPGDYQEKLADVNEIRPDHPALSAINSLIARKQAELDALKLTGSGQTHLTVGVNSDRGDNDPRSNRTESFNIGVNVPFGGSAHVQPQIAAVNVELNRLLADRGQLSRDLEQAHHEAEHNLEVNHVELGIANELKQVAEQHLAIAHSAFAAGEIDLMDLLKIQSRSQQAMLNAKERAVMLQRDQALYNQAIGMTP